MSNIITIIADKIMANASGESGADQTPGSPETTHKECIEQCDRCVWLRNGGCSEWNATKTKQ